MHIVPALAIALCWGIQFNPIDAAASTSTRCWTTVGSAGTVDEADTQIVAFDQSNATIKSGISNVTLNIRYNVVGVEGDNGGTGDFDQIVMGLRYVDNGANSRIVALLKRVNLNTGAIATLLTFDSDNFAQSGLSQIQSVSSGCSTVEPFNFDVNAYFLDVSISRAAVGGVAVFRGARVCVRDCP
jgi:hypothetical protein